MINGIAMKSKRIKIPFKLQKQVPQLLHSKHMGIEMMRLLLCESAHWLNMKTDIKML